jgi:hypothetical protein
MSPEELEIRLQRQPLRQAPSEWRAEILAVARQAARAQPATRPAQPVSPLLTLYRQLSTLIWPHPAAWAGLAAIWLVILGINVATRGGSGAVAPHSSPISRQVFMAQREQERLLAELLGPHEVPVAEPPKPSAPRPRSEGRLEMRMG